VTKKGRIHANPRVLESTKSLHTYLTAGARSSSKIGRRRWRSREIGARKPPPPPGEEKRRRGGRVGRDKAKKITTGYLNTVEKSNAGTTGFKGRYHRRARDLCAEFYGILACRCYRASAGTTGWSRYHRGRAPVPPAGQGISVEANLVWQT